MADVPRLKSPHLQVVMADGSTFDVQTLNPDLVRYDLTRAKHGWPDGTKAPFLWLTFIAWAALRREGGIPNDMTWEAFNGEHCVAVTNVTDEDEADDGVGGSPFPSAPGPD